MSGGSPRRPEPARLRAELDRPRARRVSVVPRRGTDRPSRPAPADRARGFGILFTGSSFGAMIAPPLATFLEGRWDFRVAFLCTAIVGLSWVPIWLALKFLVEAYGMKQTEVGKYLWGPPILLDIDAIRFGHFASRRTKICRNDGAPHRLLLAAAASLAALGAAIHFGGGPWGSIALAGVVMAGGGGLFALLTADMLTCLHHRYRQQVA